MSRHRQRFAGRIFSIVKSQLRTTTKKYLGSRKGVRVFLFGSRAGRHFTERSDFDVGIMILEPGGNLGRIPLRVLSQMNEEVEKIPLLAKIELVDFGRVSEEFKSVALEKVVLLYER